MACPSSIQPRDSYTPTPPVDVPRTCPKLMRFFVIVNTSVTYQELLDLRADKSACCGDVRSLAVAKRRELGQKLRALQAIVDALDTVISTCNDAGRGVNECPILHALEQGPNDEPRN
ncbi:MerR family DNA-binding protein [Acidiferrobacter sp.]|uniref:MerR family DNA-binding protein n=1 Tax=Acidiferrobacter sp. TaxID=1872107 RepID=UPI00342FDA46